MKKGGIAAAIMADKKNAEEADGAMDEAPDDSDPEDQETSQTAYDEFADAMDSGDRVAQMQALKAFIHSCSY